jgi:hypothetical protein
MSSQNPLSDLTSLTESSGGYDGDTVEELRETCRKLRQHATELQVTMDALTAACKIIAEDRNELQTLVDSMVRPGNEIVYLRNPGVSAGAIAPTNSLFHLTLPDATR